MKTPYGFDCPYFFGDYYRGRTREECRLLPPGESARSWNPALCRTCPVPGIGRANACPNQILSAQVNPGFLGIGKKMRISAYCTLSKSEVREPHVGCGSCHPLPPEFIQEKK